MTGAEELDHPAGKDGLGEPVGRLRDLRQLASNGVNEAAGAGEISFGRSHEKEHTPAVEMRPHRVRSAAKTASTFPRHVMSSQSAVGRVSSATARPSDVKARPLI